VARAGSNLERVDRANKFGSSNRIRTEDLLVNGVMNRDEWDKQLQWPHRHRRTDLEHKDQEASSGSPGDLPETTLLRTSFRFFTRSSVPTHELAPTLGGGLVAPAKRVGVDVCRHTNKGMSQAVPTLSPGPNRRQARGSRGLRGTWSDAPLGRPRPGTASTRLTKSNSASAPVARWGREILLRCE
jgi:hypothetical protein